MSKVNYPLIGDSEYFVHVDVEALSVVVIVAVAMVDAVEVVIGQFAVFLADGLVQGVVQHLRDFRVVNGLSLQNGAAATVEREQRQDLFGLASAEQGVVVVVGLQDHVRSRPQNIY